MIFRRKIFALSLEPRELSLSVEADVGGRE